MNQYIIFLPLIVLLAIFGANIKNKGLNIISAIVSIIVGIAFGLYIYFKFNYYGALNEFTFVSVCSASIFFLSYITITPLLKK